MQKSATAAAQKPIGVLILGRKRPGFDQEWNQIICGRALAALKDLGFATVGAETPVIDDATIAVALDKIRAAGCQALVMLHPSMGNGQLALTVAQQWPDPVVLWATPERPGDGKVSSCSLVGQHLWGSTLRQAGHAFELVYGDPDDKTLRAEMMRAIAIARTVAVLRSAKVGVIGTHAPGFIDLAADPFLIQRTLGTQMHPLSLPQFIERVHAIPDDAARKDVERVLDLKLPMRDVTKDDLAMSSRCYLAMRELMEEESLDAITIQCWPELPNMIGQWPYLAVSRLSTEGCAVAIEGDVDGSIGSLMSRELGAGTGLPERLAGARSQLDFLLASGHGADGYVRTDRLRGRADAGQALQYCEADGDGRKPARQRGCDDYAAVALRWPLPYDGVRRALGGAAAQGDWEHGAGGSCGNGGQRRCAGAF